MTTADQRLILCMLSAAAVAGFLSLATTARDAALLYADSDSEDDDLEEAEIQSEKSGTSTKGGECHTGRRVSAAEGMLSIETSINNSASALAKVIREVTMILRSAEPTVLPSRPANVCGDAKLQFSRESIEVNGDLSDVYVSLTNRTTWSRYIRNKVDGFRARGTVS